MKKSGLSSTALSVWALLFFETILNLPIQAVKLRIRHVVDHLIQLVPCRNKNRRLSAAEQIIDRYAEIVGDLSQRKGRDAFFI